MKTRTKLAAAAWLALGSMWLRPARAQPAAPAASPAPSSPSAPAAPTTPARPAAAAGIIATATTPDGARLQLHTQPGPCTGRARLAIHTTPEGEPTPGCWLMTHTIVRVSFLDGERGDIPISHLQWAREI